MDSPAERPRHRTGRWGAVVVLALAGGAAFWVANFAIYMTPVAADNRAALAISYLPMLLEALAGGLILGCAASVILVRVPDRVPGRDPFTQAIALSVAALVIVTVAIEMPAKLFGGIPEAGRYFVTGTVFNAIRILALGAAIGAVARRDERPRQPVSAPRPTHA
ncbi:MAG: hypothetical protein M0Z51_12020 [Propionibacterium sp.]|nr:hypothetical protein [Propionibacterium sp.]